MWRQPKAVWAVAFASVVAFMGIGLVDPILKPIADNLDASPSQVSLLFTSYMAVMGVAMLITGRGRQPHRAQAHPADRAGDHHRRGGTRRPVGHRDGHRRVARTVGPRQRAVHRDGAGHHRQLRPRLGRPGDHPVRGRPRPRHRGGPARRRGARRDLLARAVLRRLGPDGVALVVTVFLLPSTPPPHAPPAWSTPCGRSATAACSASESPRCSTTSASSPSWRSRRSRST